MCRDLNIILHRKLSRLFLVSCQTSPENLVKILWSVLWQTAKQSNRQIHKNKEDEKIHIKITLQCVLRQYMSTKISHWVKMNNSLLSLDDCKITYYKINQMTCEIIITGRKQQDGSIAVTIQHSTRGHFYYQRLTLIPAWISNYIHYKLWGEITYPFLNFNGSTFR